MCVCVCVCVCSVVSDSLQPHGLQPTRLLCPWNFPGKNTGVGYHFHLQGIFLTQRLNLHLFCIGRQISLPLAPPGKPLPPWKSSKENLKNDLMDFYGPNNFFFFDVRKNNIFFDP